MIVNPEIVQGLVARGRRRREITFAGGAALAIGTSGFLLGFITLIHRIPGAAGPASASPAARNFLDTYLSILGHNVPVALLMMSGLVTMGVTTFLGCFLAFSFVGATLAAAVTVAGSAAALGSVLVYAPLELAAFLIAAAAGLLPMSTMLARSRPSSRYQAYTNAFRTSLGLFVISVVTLLAAGALEAFVILQRS